MYLNTPKAAIVLVHVSKAWPNNAREGGAALEVEAVLQPCIRLKGLQVCFSLCQPSDCFTLAQKGFSLNINLFNIVSALSRLFS